jgi:hypothetical protein
VKNIHVAIKNLFLIGWLALLTPAYAVTNAPAHIYPSGMEIAVKIGNDLVATLDPKFQKILNPEAISMKQMAAPVMEPIQGNRQGLRCQVSVSTGFIDLLNHIAHAKAIDRIQPGFFNQYVALLAQEGANDPPVLPPNLEDSRYWTDAVMQDQTSYFNQMISITLALNLSHLYLDHCGKYAAQMPEGKPAPINNFIAADEWKASVKHAALNSLDCALATEGAEALFDCIDQMPWRPAWTDYIVPQGVNIKSLNKQLSQYESDYFSGNPTFMHPRRTLTLLASKASPTGLLAAQTLARLDKPQILHPEN